MNYLTLNPISNFSISSRLYPISIQSRLSPAHGLLVRLHSTPPAPRAHLPSPPRASPHPRPRQWRWTRWPRMEGPLLLPGAGLLLSSAGLGGRGSSAAGLGDLGGRGSNTVGLGGRGSSAAGPGNLADCGSGATGLGGRGSSAAGPGDLGNPGSSFGGLGSAGGGLGGHGSSGITGADRPSSDNGPRWATRAHLGFFSFFQINGGRLQTASINL